jgi:hypothetical protein
MADELGPPVPPWRDGPVTITPPAPPWRDGPVTITCPVCQQGFTRKGKRQWCSPACKTEAWRRRHQADRPAVVVPLARPRRPITVYECDGCGARAVGHQRCEDCGTFMRKIGLGGPCPHCDEPVSVTELLDQEVVPSN